MRLRQAGRPLWAALALVLSAVACAYQIGPLDVLAIRVERHEELSGTFTVSEAGTITYPLLGKVEVEGLDPEQVAARLKEGLERDYLRRADVYVEVAEINSKKVTVFGDLPGVGVKRLRTRTTLLELLSELEGLDPRVHRKLVLVRAGSKGGGGEEGEGQAIQVDLRALLVDGDMRQNLAVEPGDTIYIAAGEERKVYVVGEVKQPGPYVVPEGTTVFGAINAAGGFTEYASRSRVRLVRKTPEGEEEVSVNLESVARAGPQEDPPVAPGDVIYVPRSWF